MTQTAYFFDADGVLQSGPDRSGNGLTFGYGGSGRLTSRRLSPFVSLVRRRVDISS
jgi:YD repeat-containing protein